MSFLLMGHKFFFGVEGLNSAFQQTTLHPIHRNEVSRGCDVRGSLKKSCDQENGNGKRENHPKSHIKDDEKTEIVVREAPLKFQKEWWAGEEDKKEIPLEMMVVAE